VGHHVQAFIVRRDRTDAIRAGLREARAFALSPEWALIPMTPELFDEITDRVDGGDLAEPAAFWLFGPAQLAWALQESQHGPIVYFETDYFGGVGTQAAGAWSGDRELVAPTKAHGAINLALRAVGIERRSVDEFASIGLDRFRSNEDWLEGGAAIEQSPSEPEEGRAKPR
jgi:hypothetical protein